MAWSDILGHKRIKRILCTAIRENRIASAYLLTGTEGIGKEALSFEFAKSINCINPIDDGELIHSCGKCINCKQLANFSHPDFHFIFALPPGKSTDSKSESSLDGLSQDQISEITSQIQLKKVDVYHKIQLPNAKQIKISAIRELKRILSRSTESAKRIIVIVSEADKMTTEASNAFLKTLEEPREKITIILNSSRKESIMQTILSRCQLINCEPIPDPEIAEYIIRTQNVDETQARLVASFANGSVSRINEFLNEDMQQLRKDVVDTLRSAMKGKTYKLELVSQLEYLVSKEDKNRIIASLALLTIWLKDAMLIQNNYPKGVVNLDQFEVLQKFAAHYSDKNLVQAILVIEIAIKRINGNVAPQLALLTMYIELRKLFLH